MHLYGRTRIGSGAVNARTLGYCARAAAAGRNAHRADDAARVRTALPGRGQRTLVLEPRAVSLQVGASSADIRAKQPLGVGP